MKNCYIAGPMRGYTKFNFDSFDTATVLGRTFGYRIFNPANFDRAVGVDGSTPDLPEGFCRECVLRDIACILSCQYIAMLPGWTKSTGAMAEYHLAKWLGLTILSATNFQPIEEHHV